MYKQDSFFTLTQPQQVGLAVLSVLLGVALILLARRLARGRAWPVRGLIGLGLVWMFTWSSPQIYYFYYLSILPGLPVQNVIGPPPGVADVVQILFAQAGQTLSAHAQMLLGWATILAAFVRMPQRSELTGP